MQVIHIQIAQKTTMIVLVSAGGVLCRIHGVVVVKISIYMVTAVLAMVKFFKTAQETAVEMLSLINAAHVTQTPIITVHRIVRMNGEALQV